MKFKLVSYTASVSRRSPRKALLNTDTNELVERVGFANFGMYGHISFYNGANINTTDTRKREWFNEAISLMQAGKEFEVPDSYFPTVTRTPSLIGKVEILVR